VVVYLRNEAQFKEAIGSVVAEFGGIDILANVAGGLFAGTCAALGGADRIDSAAAEWHRPVDCSTDEWDVNVHMNLRYVFWLCREVVPKMAARGAGSTVSVTPISGVFGSPNHAAYGAAKAGLIHLTKTLAVEYGRSNIRVNAVSRGSIATPTTGMDAETQAVIGRNTPLQRAGEPADIAGAILYFASPMFDYVTGQMLLVDGGFGSRFPFSVSGDPSESSQFI
jgi:NAD(P)-dependent dehydrogenase (short-subunit alcohol dehydrogenase family)